MTCICCDTLQPQICMRRDCVVIAQCWSRGWQSLKKVQVVTNISCFRLNHSCHIDASIQKKKRKTRQWTADPCTAAPTRNHSRRTRQHTFQQEYGDSQCNIKCFIVTITALFIYLLHSSPPTTNDWCSNEAVCVDVTENCLMLSSPTWEGKNNIDSYTDALPFVIAESLQCGMHCSNDELFILIHHVCFVYSRNFIDVVPAVGNRPGACQFSTRYRQVVFYIDHPSPTFSHEPTQLRPDQANTAKTQSGQMLYCTLDWSKIWQ